MFVIYPCTADRTAKNRHLMAKRVSLIIDFVGEIPFTYIQFLMIFLACAFNSFVQFVVVVECEFFLFP